MDAEIRRRLAEAYLKVESAIKKSRWPKNLMYDKSKKVNQHYYI